MIGASVWSMPNSRSPHPRPELPVSTRRPKADTTPTVREAPPGEAERAADRDGGSPTSMVSLAPSWIGVRPSARDLEHGEVGDRIGPDHRGREHPAVGEHDLWAEPMLRHVVVGDDVAGVVEDHPRARSLRRDPVGSLETDLDCHHRRHHLGADGGGVDRGVGQAGIVTAPLLPSLLAGPTPASSKAKRACVSESPLTALITAMPLTASAAPSKAESTGTHQPRRPAAPGVDRKGGTSEWEKWTWGESPRRPDGEGGLRLGVKVEFGHGIPHCLVLPESTVHD